MFQVNLGELIAPLIFFIRSKSMYGLGIDQKLPYVNLSAEFV